LGKDRFVFRDGKTGYFTIFSPGSCHEKLQEILSACP
jgi:hypothetical protein